uniref:Structural maintenance of chromosomes protein 4 n=1 Tax=Cacopsylla melanoneura TaxID=428564 RepID=A0A8D8QVP6_9HEMI
MKEEKEDRLQQVMTSIASETGALQDKKNELQKVQIELRKEFDEAKSKCDIAKSELEIYLSTQSKETKRLADLESNLEKVTATLTERQTTYEELTSRIPEMESEISQSKARLADLTREETELTESIRALSREVSEKRESMQVNRSADRMSNFVMQLKTENRVSGILGRLGDLGGIDAKYDVAVSTACGALSYIVTETVEAGEAVIAAVKRQNVGRVNVIPLDKMQQYYNKCYQKYRTPENVPRLIDLISVEDERMRLAFYYATRETLVATDLNQAKRIGYSGQGYRLVTLDGAIVEPSGTMTGGGNQPVRGQMGRKATVSTDATLAVDLETKEKQMAAMEMELRILSQRRMEVETSLNCTTNELKYKKQDYATCQIDVKSLSEQEPDLRKQITAQQVTLSKVNIDQTKRTELETNVADLTTIMNEKQKKVDELESKVSTVHEQIMAISSGKTSELNKDLSEISSKLDKTKSTINKLHAGINANDRDVKKSSDKVSNLREEISDTESKLEAVRGKLESIQQELTENESSAEQYRKELKEVQRKYATLKKTFDANNEEMEKVQGKIKTATKELAEARAQMETIRGIVNKLEKKLSTLKLHELLDITQVDGFIEVKTSVSDPLRSFSDEELAAKTEDDLRKELESIRAQFPEEVPNLAVVEDYKQKHEMYMRRVSELHATTQERNKYRKGIMDTQKRRTHEFNAAFQLIADKVKETYQLLTTYGSADMSLDDNLNPFSQGINYAIRPPMKSWKYISNLSGGEKTIASLALVFALHYYKPSPLYFLDEIDAALDVRNVAIIGHYIKERTVNAQFIIISLRPECFDLADRIIGIYKVFNKSNSKAIDPKVLDVLNPHYKPYVRPELNQASQDKPSTELNQASQDKPTATALEVEKVGTKDSEKEDEEEAIKESDKENRGHNEDVGESAANHVVKGPSKVRKELLKAMNSNGKEGESVDGAKQNQKSDGKERSKDDKTNDEAIAENNESETDGQTTRTEDMESTFEDIPYRKRAHRKRKSTEENAEGNEETRDDEQQTGKEPESKKAKPSDEVNETEDDELVENTKQPARTQRNGAKQKKQQHDKNGAAKVSSKEVQRKDRGRRRRGQIESEDESEKEEDNDQDMEEEEAESEIDGNDEEYSERREELEESKVDDSHAEMQDETEEESENNEDDGDDAIVNQTESSEETDVNQTEVSQESDDDDESRIEQENENNSDDNSNDSEADDFVDKKRNPLRRGAPQRGRAKVIESDSEASTVGSGKSSVSSAGTRRSRRGKRAAVLVDESSEMSDV